MATPKVGPLTRDDLRALWRGALDSSYSGPFERAGDGGGLEAHGQVWAQLARASAAVDKTTQAMFVRPWSGQTGQPAGGEARSLVTLTLSRTKLLQLPLRLRPGELVVDEETTDMAPGGGVEVLTGRRYLLAQELLLMPGDAGPVQAAFVAEAPGEGYDNPMPGTIRFVDQPGAGFTNAGAKVVAVGPLGLVEPARATARIVAADAPDMFVPDHVGQQVFLLAGANAGAVARIQGFVDAQPTAVPPVGSGADLELLQVVDATVFAGVFVAGETVNFTNGGPVVAAGQVVGEETASGVKKLAFDLLRGDFSLVTPGVTLATGAGSGATLAVRAYLDKQLLASEPANPGATWKVLSWADDWGLTATNPASPSGGRTGLLDELGAERNINRAPGEGDDSYRQRVAEIADVVTPNAVRRALSRALGVIPWCLREVGTPKFMGMFFDGNLAAPSIVPHGAVNDCFDADVLVFTGGTAGAFRFQEPVVVETTAAGPPLVAARGWFGRSSEVGTVVTIIRRDGQLPATFAPGAFRVRGLLSGATYVVGAQTPTAASASARRFREWVDYSQFRGFFLVGVPRLSMGDFGFAYDAGASDAYDAAPAPAFYDGAPVGSAAVYARVRGAVDPIKAGGVGWDLYLTNEACAAPVLPADDAAIDPLSIPSLWAWFLADAGVAVDVASQVVTWSSSSPGGVVAQSQNPFSRPLFLQNTVRFVRSAVRANPFSHRLLAGARVSLPAGLSIHAVLRTTSATTPSSNPGVVPPNPVVGDVGGAGTANFGLNVGAAEYDYGGVALTGGAGLNSGAVVSIGVTHDQATGNARLFANGVVVASAVMAYNPATTGLDALLAGFGAPADAFFGDVFEVVVSQVALPDPTMAALHARAAAIWI